MTWLPPSKRVILDWTESPPRLAVAQVTQSGLESGLFCGGGRGRENGRGFLGQQVRPGPQPPLRPSGSGPPALLGALRGSLYASAYLVINYVQFPLLFIRVPAFLQQGSRRSFWPQADGESVPPCAVRPPASHSQRSRTERRPGVSGSQ